MLSAGWGVQVGGDTADTDAVRHRLRREKAGHAEAVGAVVRVLHRLRLQVGLGEIDPALRCRRAGIVASLLSCAAVQVPKAAQMVAEEQRRWAGLTMFRRKMPKMARALALQYLHFSAHVGQQLRDVHCCQGATALGGRGEDSIGKQLVNVQTWGNVRGVPPPFREEVLD
mmetsp:Transcript_147123/g.472524  ORF Transcript_147123/g.472524 Transcript_147123/m.472524 type:complete len:170 (-) Transcript_147123:443-952(-)